MSSLTAEFINAYVDRYEVRERLGAGGMASVYRAHDKTLERSVAIKILHEHLSSDATFKERFEREAKFVAGFNHPNIVQVYDFAAIEHEERPIFYMVMPYLSGPTLVDVLEDTVNRQTRLPHERVLQIMLDLLSALGYAHQRGMIHRDVKPANVLCDENGRAILTDFGIARLAEGSHLTQEGITIGTPAYMSPEQATSAEVDTRSDLYALGVILYEMLAGQQPFQDENTLSVMLQHVNAPIPRVSKFLHMENESLDAVVFQALAKEPVNRYQTADEFADDIRAVLKGEAIANPPIATAQLPHVNDDPTTQIPRAPSKVKRTTRAQSPLAILAVGLGIIVFLLIIGIIAQRQSPQSIIEPLADENLPLVDSMTADFYFESTFESDDPLLDSWPQTTSAELTREITPNGEYSIRNARPDSAAITLFDPIYTYRNIVITMEATLAPESARVGGYGIVFRYVDPDNYYVFAVDGDGRYSIWAREAGDWQELRNLSEEWNEHSAILPIGETNTLQVSLFDDRLIGFVNDQQIVDIQDSLFSDGAVGVYLATPPRSGDAIVVVDTYVVAENNVSLNTLTTDEFAESMTSDDYLETTTPEA